MRHGFQTLTGRLPSLAAMHHQSFVSMRSSRRPPRLIGNAWCVVTLLAIAWGRDPATPAWSQEPVPPPSDAGERGPPLPAVGEPPPLYLADPQQAAGFAGIPTGDAADRLPGWPRWFAGASGLVMTRTLPAGVATMQPVGGTQLFTSSAAASWPGGVDLHVGRWFGPRQRHAVEFIYWGVFNIGSTATAATNPAAIEAIPQAPGVTVGGLSASAFLLNGAAQQITRSDLVNDVEINWIFAPWDRPEFDSRDPSQPTRTMNLMWLAGFRFFELEDVLTQASFAAGTSDSAVDLSVATNNNLYGGQVGAKFDWRFLPRLRCNVVPKFLIAGNAITNTTSLTSAGGTPAVFATGAPVNAHSTLGVFSWLGSVDTGLAWDVTDRWSLSLGYRVVGLGNVALADGQWPTPMLTPAAISGIEAGSSTIVHGGFAGFEGRW